jgi:hypothetical protein
MLGLDLDSSRWESMLGRDGKQKLLFGVGRKKITIGTQGGINTLRSGTSTTIFESPNLQARSWNILEPLGAARNFREKLRGFVDGMILVLKKTLKNLISSMPLLVSLLIVRLVLYSNSK